jgi:hypothetical protein
MLLNNGIENNALYFKSRTFYVTKKDNGDQVNDNQRNDHQVNDNQRNDHQVNDDEDSGEKISANQVYEMYLR